MKCIQASQQALMASTSLDSNHEEGAHPSAQYGTNPSVLIDKTKSARDGLNAVQTDTSINEGSSSHNIKLEDLAHVMYDTRSAFFSEDFLEEPIIVTNEIPPPPSPKSILIQELQAQVQTLQSQKLQLEQEKAQAEAEVVSLRSQSKYPDINKLTKLLFTATLNRFESILQNTSQKAGDTQWFSTAGHVPTAGQVTSPAEGEKNTNQATISQLFQRKFAKDAEKENLK
ncbi:hypothetical protein Tco_1352925 [Tanacetum coccineum]